ncbi:MAG TPA: filamentous hemagglutinin N-terminal domain-containing protein [Burkholderiales bacterium]|nr:filamentous hemagglutinin N-terminal domain-containing protein [Burkholderiales bacterium]
MAVALALGAAVFEARSQSISSTALPSGGRVVGGEAAISQQGAAMAVDQASARAAIDWQSFNIGSQASVTFNQPSASAIALNRVIGTNGSEIFGRLSANGQVFLVNPNGVLFGRGAQVDVGGLLASTLSMSVDDFMAGRHALRREGEARPVVNQGSIRTAPRGYVALIAPSVANEGSIESPLGTVSLAAGSAATVDFMADGLVQIRVDEGALQAEVANHGALLAEGGYVLLTAKGLDSLARAVVNNTGIVEARSVKILGDEVILGGAARIDASGETGGGEILIGGNYQGKGPEQNALRTYVGPDVTIAADAITSGDGGRVIVWSDESTQFHGSISARGGAVSGNGGFVETSGATLQVTGTVDTSAPNGAFGTWLLDPRFLRVEAGGENLTPTINDTFASNVSGTTIIDPASINSSLSHVVLQANTDVEFRDPVDIAARGTSLTVQAGRSIIMNSNTSIKTNDGHVSFTANDDFGLVVALDREGGPAEIKMGSNTSIDAGKADISLRIGTGCLACLDRTSGDVAIEKLVARTVGIVHQGQTGSILRASDASLIRAKEVFMEIESAAGPTSSIGTQSKPIRISADKLEAHYHFASGGIFIDSPEARDLQIGGVHSPLGGGGGIQAGDASVGSGGGPIEIRANGNLIQQAGPAGCGVAGTSPGGPICSVDGPITLTATGAIKVDNIIRTSNASANAIVLSAGDRTAAGTASGGDVIIGSGAVLSFGANGRATLFTGSIAGSSGVTALVGSGSGNFRYNSSPTSTGYSAPLGGGVYAIYRERPTLTVNANSPNAITYGSAAPAYTFALTGLQNGDSAAC